MPDYEWNVYKLKNLKKKKLSHENKEVPMQFLKQTKLKDGSENLHYFKFSHQR